MKKVLILDFGGQYNLLVARRVRECGVYCELKSFRISMDEVRSFRPDALIFTGGPASVYDADAPLSDPGLFELDLPVLLKIGDHLAHGGLRIAQFVRRLSDAAGLHSAEIGNIFTNTHYKCPQ